MIDNAISYIVGVATAFVIAYINIRTMSKCSVCGRRFEIRKENTYRAFEPGSITFARRVFDAVDCPHCGCQHLLKIREERMEEKKQ